MGEYKLCSRCKNNKLIEDFQWNNKNFGIRKSKCKKCISEICQENKDKIKERKKKYYENNKDFLKEKAKEYRLKNSEYIKNYRTENKEKIYLKNKDYKNKNIDKYREIGKICSKKYRKNNREKCIERTKKSIENNIEKYKRYRKEYKQRKETKEKLKILREIPQNKLKSNISSSIRKKLKNRISGKFGRKTWVNILPYSVEELKEHLESKFKEGMSWENYGEWHIDHVTPDSWFDYTSPDDDGFKKSWSLENLQPLWASENCSKSNRYKN